MDGEVWGVPRWVCGHFLFRRGGAALRATDLPAMAHEIDEVLVDLAGAANLGEWYLISVIGRDATADLGDPTDPRAEADLRALLDRCPSGLCRDRAHHDAALSSWARRFFSGEATSYVGYSETSHVGLEQAAYSCINHSDCPSNEEIRVDALPIAPSGARIGWVDGLVIRAGVAGRKRRAAVVFTQWLVSPEAYDVVLTPEWPEPPRYLLPAVPGWKASWGTLYPKFEEAWGRRTFRSGGLSDLRRHGETLEQALEGPPTAPPPP
jgi:thiamine pyridinylase